jgi:hypothetical protein
LTNRNWAKEKSGEISKAKSKSFFIISWLKEQGKYITISFLLGFKFVTAAYCIATDSDSDTSVQLQQVLEHLFFFQTFQVQ